MNALLSFLRVHRIESPSSQLGARPSRPHVGPVAAPREVPGWPNMAFVAEVPTWFAANTGFPLEPPPVPWVNVVEFWEAYRGNEAAAEHRFAHRPLCVAGAAVGVGRADGGHVLRFAVPGHVLARVDARLDVSEADVVRALRPGALVVLFSRRVHMEGGGLVLDDSHVVEGDLAERLRRELT